MEYGKYIIIKNGNFEQAIMFHSSISHDTFLEIFKDKIISAGMFVVGAEPSDNDEKDIDVSVFGESVTLNKQVRKSEDEKLLKKILRPTFL